MIDALSEAETFERLKRQIWRLCDLRPCHTSELLHFTGEDMQSLLNALHEMPSIMWIGNTWKVVAP